MILFEKGKVSRMKDVVIVMDEKAENEHRLEIQFSF